MNQHQRTVILSLKGKTLQPDSFDERFVNDMVYRAENEVGYKLSDKQNIYLFKLAKRFQVTKDVTRQMTSQKTFVRVLETDQAKLIVCEGKNRILREVLQEFSEATAEWLLENGNGRAKSVLELTQDE